MYLVLDIASVLSNGCLCEPSQVQLHWIARALKSLYAEKYNVPLERLLTDRKFKDSHRQGLIALYEELVTLDPTFEVLPIIQAIEQSPLPYHIVVDLRLKPELKELVCAFGNSNRISLSVPVVETDVNGTPKYILIHVRLVANPKVRRDRGVELSNDSLDSMSTQESSSDFSSSVSQSPQPSPAQSTDAHVTECDLDDILPDLVYENNTDGEESILKDLVPKLRELMKM